MMVICVLDTGAHPEMTLPRGAWVWLNRFRTGAGRFRSCLYKWGMVFGVTQNKPSTMLSSNVQSIDLPTDCMA